MTETQQRENPRGRRSSYFFLSYAHSAPLAGSLRADPDQWVRKFFHDLSDAVERHTSPPRLAPAFFDQDLPVKAPWKAAVTDALSVAEVFVPLLSPGYYARSWSGREWSCFRTRLIDAEVTDIDSQFAPVLWSPLYGDHSWRGLEQALELGQDEPAYAENGLRAMLRLSLYRDSYRRIVTRLASRIAERTTAAPLSPSPAPAFDEVTSAFTGQPAAVFVVTVAAPDLASLPADRDRLGYGGTAAQWRAYPYDQVLPLAEYAAQVAEQLDFTVEVKDITESSSRGASKPGVVLIDPWIAHHEAGVAALADYVSRMPSWVLPLPVLDSVTTSRDADLAERVRVILSRSTPRTKTASRAVRGVTSLKEFMSLMPILVTEAERQYLRRDQDPRSPDGDRSWLRLQNRPAMPLPGSGDNDV